MKECNVHMHLFTMNNAPKKFLHLYLPGPIADAVDRITNTKVGSAAVQKLMKLLGGSGGKRYASFLAIGKSRNQGEVFEKLVKAYPGSDMQFVALTMYMEACGAGISNSGFLGQLEEILTIRDKYPEKLLVFLGVDPRWKSSGKELRAEVERLFETKRTIGGSREIYPFAGIKLYPSTGFFAFDPKLKDTLEWAAENKVPVMTHCYYLGGIYNNDSDYLTTALSTSDPYDSTGAPVNRPYIRKKNFGKWLMGRQGGSMNQKSCSYFLEPYSYRNVLSYFQNKNTPLKLCLAHFGGSEELLKSKTGSRKYESNLEPYGVARKNWFEQIQKILKDFPSTYADISYSLTEPDVWDVMFKEINSADYGDRILFGTDYFLAEREGPEMQNVSRFRKKAEVFKLVNGDNAWQQIAVKNADSFLRSKYNP